MVTRDNAGPPPDPPDSWWELEAELHPAAEELWGLFCHEQGALGAEIVEDAGPRRIVRHSFATQPAADTWPAAFAAAYPRVPPPLRLTLRRQAVEAWETAWRTHFAPLRLGRRLLVTPPWFTRSGPEAGSAFPGAPDDADRLRIVIDPGQGFGTGWHPSTAAALLALEAVPETPPDGVPGAAPEAVLDVGTGSGILAIAARLLGVRRAVALDVDGVALPEVRRNAALSGLVVPPAVFRGRPDCLRGAFPLVVANIVTKVLVAHRDDLAALTAQGGCLILSGILAQEAAAVTEAYAAAGLRLHGEQRREGWVALTLRRD